MGIEYFWVAWPVTMTIGGITSGVVGYRMGKKAQVKTFFDTAVVSLWYAFTITLFLILLAAGAGKITWRHGQCFYHSFIWFGNIYFRQNDEF